MFQQGFSENCINMADCPHINEAVDLASLRNALSQNGLLNCCKQCEEEFKSSSSGKRSDLWMCLKCGNQACSRFCNQHALKHFEIKTLLLLGDKLVNETDKCESHACSVNTSDWKVWCYVCTKYVIPNKNRRTNKFIETLEYLQNFDKNGASHNDECPVRDHPKSTQPSQVSPNNNKTEKNDLEIFMKKITEELSQMRVEFQMMTTEFRNEVKEIKSAFVEKEQLWEKERKVLQEENTLLKEKLRSECSPEESKGIKNVTISWS